MPVPRILAAAFAALLAAACAQSPSQPEGPPIDAQQVLQSFAQTRGPLIAVGTITAADPALRAIKCRGSGFIGPPGGLTFVRYIERALIEQFTIAPGYADDSPIRLEGHVERIEFNSINPGHWEIAMSFRAAGIAPFRVHSVHRFPTGNNGDVACPQVTQALPDAMQDLLARLVVHPSFRQLLAASPR